MAQIQKLLPLRESTPTLRAMTGALFGLMLAWMAYPQVNKGMIDTERDLGEKLDRIEESEQDVVRK